MKRNVFAAFIILSTLFLAGVSRAVPQCGYATTTEKKTVSRGAPWSATYYSSEVPVGTCDNYGRTDASDCYQAAVRNNFKCFQMETTSVKKYHGSIWSSSEGEFKVCYVCY